MKSTDKLEIFTNIAIISVAVLLGIFIIQKFFVSENLPSQPVEIAKGEKISFPDFDWQANRKTLVLVLQKDCKFCTESMPFYKKLVERSKEKGIRVVAVLPDSRESGVQYLKENGVDVQEVKQALKGSINVRGTPALILTNDQGEVLDFWIGKLSFEKELEVMENL